MNDMAKIISSGDGQVVELPEGYRFEGTEVRVRREGQRVVLEPVDLEVDEETGLTLNELRALIAEGEDESGDAPWNVEEILREARDGFEMDKRV